MKWMCLLFTAASLCAAARFSAAQSAASAKKPETPIEIGRWAARFLPGGLYLDFDGIPLIKGGVVQLFSAATRSGYYGSGSSPPLAEVEVLEGGGRAYMTEYRYTAGGNSFFAEQRIEVRPGNSVSMSIRCRWEGSEAALLEWNPSRLWAYPLMGAPFEAAPARSAPDSRPAQGTVPVRPLPQSAIANRIADGWSRLTLRTAKIGDLTIRDDFAGSGSDSPVLLDGRSDPYLKRDRLLWLGFPTARLEPGREYRYALTLTIAPGPAAPTPIRGEGSARSPLNPLSPRSAELMHAQVRAIPDALLSPAPLYDAAGGPVIIPQPKHAAFTNADFILRGRVPLIIALPQTESGRRAERAAREFASELRARAGVIWSEQRPGASRAWSGRGILVTTIDPGMHAHPLTPPLALQPEGYALLVTPIFAAVIGRDPAGAFYGLQTLRQLLRVDREAGSSTVPGRRRRSRPRFLGADITDWPSLRMRAAHLFVGKEALPFHRKLIDRILARYKLNTLVLECEYTRWRSHPEIWQPYSMEPDDLRQEVSYARDRFMEPIPLVNSLGHSEWIFKSGQHLDLAEDVEAPHAYDASNPESYRFVFDVFAEAIDIFRPRYFHIGHDEVNVPGQNLSGKYPARPRNIEKGVTALFMEDTDRLSKWLGARGVVPILWGDMLLHSSEGPPAGGSEMAAANAPTLEEAVTRRSLLPNGAIIADWRYEPGSEQRNGLEIFRSAGHEALGSAWYSPENIRGWAHQAIANGALGTLQTTWAGYDSREALLDEEYRQFTAFILAAEYAWSGTTHHPRPEIPDASTAESDLLPYHAPDVFAHSYRDDLRQAARSPGWCLDLSTATNISLADSINSWPPITAMKLIADTGKPEGGARANAGGGARSRHDLYRTSYGLAFRLSMPRPAGIMLSGLLQSTIDPAPNGAGSALPSAVSLSVGSSARELAFVHATLVGLEAGALAASYIVRYGDGQSITIPLRYGREIRALDDGSADQSFSIEPVSVTPSCASLYVLRWLNPHPDLPIIRIEFRTDSPLASPILFAVTGLR